MTVTFSGVTLPNASKLRETRNVLLTETILLSGKRSIQGSDETGLEATYRCFGSWAEYAAILALVGSAASLVTANSTYTNCYISKISVEESDNPSWYYFEVGFKQDTTS